MVEAVRPVKELGGDVLDVGELPSLAGAEPQAHKDLTSVSG